MSNSAKKAFGAKMVASEAKAIATESREFAQKVYELQEGMITNVRNLVEEYMFVKELLAQNEQNIELVNINLNLHKAILAMLCDDSLPWITRQILRMLGISQLIDRELTNAERAISIEIERVQKSIEGDDEASGRTIVHSTVGERGEEATSQEKTTGNLD